MGMDDESLEDLSWDIGPAILVVLEITEIESNRQLDLKFFHTGRKVQFCGSGLLAAAHYIEKKYQISLSDEPLTTRLNSLEIAIGKSFGRYSLTAAPNLKRIQGHARNLSALLGLDIEDLVELEAGYLIAEIASPLDLLKLSPDLTVLEDSKWPALVVTAPGQVNLDEDKSDYVMRYFAPQYGNPEDAATGSANLYLMKYWQQKLKKNQLIGRQLSKEGGLFFGHVSGERVTLSGQTK